MKTGKVIREQGTLVYPHEERVAYQLATAGHNVTFLAVGIDKSQKGEARQEGVCYCNKEGWRFDRFSLV